MGWQDDADRATRRTLEGTTKHVISHGPKLRNLLAKAIHQLVIYQLGVHANTDLVMFCVVNRDFIHHRG